MVKFDIRKSLGLYPSPWDSQRMFLPRVTMDEADVLPEEMTDLVKYVPNPYPNQGSIGDCVGWAWANWMYISNALEDATPTHELFSAWDAYQKARKYDDLPDYLGEGSNNLGGAKGLQKEGVCYETCLPTPIKAPIVDIKPCLDYKCYGISQYFQVNRQPADLKAAICGKVNLPNWGGPSPIVAGIYVYESFNAVESDGIIPVPFSGEKLLGGHAICVSAYKKINGVLHLGFLNSWTADWGDNGWGWLPFDEANIMNSYYPYLMDAWTGHVEPVVIPTPNEPSTCPVAKVWTGIYNVSNSIVGGKTWLEAKAPKEVKNV